jgi:heterogeneous nuclear ribonucleoprotein F/H
VFESTEADLQAAKHLASDGLLPGHIVRLRGLPYAAREGDVRTFLTGAGVRLADVPNSIVIAQTAEGAPLGEAFAQLAEAADVGLALTRHKEVLGGRYIEVFASSRVKLFHAFQQTQINTRPRNKRCAPLTLWRPWQG